MAEKLPQRFRWMQDGAWQYGVCFWGGTLWQVLAGRGHGSFRDDPWEIVGHILGDTDAFEWIDNDYGWTGNKMPAPYLIDGAFSIGEWATRIIQGSGGMDDYERYELVVWHQPERVAAACWVLRCLANPKCEGSQHVLDAIQERRNATINQSNKEG